MKRIIITESQYNYILNSGSLIKEQEEESLETFDFSNSYPPNIAFPIKPNSSIKSTKGALNPANLNSGLMDFINKLKLKIKNGTKITGLRINSGASSDKATTNVPDGYTQDLVNYSLKSDNGNQSGKAFGTQIKMLVSNDTLKKNRANFMKIILTNLIPELKGIKIEINTNLSEKAVNIQIPSSVMVNFKTHPVISKEYVEPKSIYKPSFDNPSVIANCNEKSDASGNGGVGPKFIADRIKLNTPEGYSGAITFKYNSFVIPDRFQLLQVKGGKEKILQDTNFVTTATDNNTFNIFKNEIKTYGGTLKQSGEGSLTFNAEPGSQYYVDVIAPFGGTAWQAQLGCSKSVEKPKEEKIDWGSKPKVFSHKGVITQDKPEKLNQMSTIVIGDFQKNESGGNVKDKYSGKKLPIFVKDGVVLNCTTHHCKQFGLTKYSGGKIVSDDYYTHISNKPHGKLDYYGLT